MFDAACQPRRVAFLYSYYPVGNVGICSINYGTRYEVGPPLLDQNRYHMPIIGVLNHPIKSHSSYKRKVFMFEQNQRAGLIL
jgi:hypothetical protein